MNDYTDERVDFEEMISKVNAHRIGEDVLKRRHDGEYYRMSVQNMWEMWLHATQRAKERMEAKYE